MFVTTDSKCEESLLKCIANPCIHTRAHTHTHTHTHTRTHGLSLEVRPAVP